MLFIFGPNIALILLSCISIGNELVKVDFFQLSVFPLVSQALKSHLFQISFVSFGGSGSSKSIAIDDISFLNHATGSACPVEPHGKILPLLVWLDPSDSPLYHMLLRINLLVTCNGEFRK